MKKELRKELSIGLLCFAISLVLKQFTAAPEFIMGGLMGLSICLEVIGVLPDKAYCHLKEWKLRFLGRV